MDRLVQLKLRFVPFQCLQITELHWFLGKAGYYHEFSCIYVAPLTDLLSTKVPFEWTTVSQ